MSLRRTGGAVLLGCVLASCGGGREGSRGPAERPPAMESQASGAEEPAAGGENLREIVVLFASTEDALLHGETRSIFWTASVEERAKQALGEVLAGPSAGLVPVLPPNATLREFYLLPDGTGWADFSREILDQPGGTEAEGQAIYAIVNTLILNFPEVRRVGILVEGEEVETLSGHLDLRYPFTADPDRVEPELAARLAGGGAAGPAELAIRDGRPGPPAGRARRSA